MLSRTSCCFERLVFSWRSFLCSGFDWKYVLGVKDDDSLDKDSMKVTAVLTREGEIAPLSFSLADVAQDGWVRVMTGNEVLRFTGLTCTDIPCSDLSEVSTPPTPPNADALIVSPLH